MHFFVSTLIIITITSYHTHFYFQSRAISIKMVIENKTRRIKQLIKVDVNRTIPLDKISNWTKHLADEVFRSIPDGDDDVDIVITLDFSGSS
ncbi:hypothetical protein B9Z55_006134 [Caenorhabditis nigoni]|uniref:Uncharacterized protein n=1 Tax=Caenorhabditis nigoni TaxID=1611254 RepID=A0A2G5V489_9PELO|nr:hypothetical protein B9Z55_006134 [Caenorhabditis nigoni]